MRASERAASARHELTSGRSAKCQDLYPRPRLDHDELRGWVHVRRDLALRRSSARALEHDDMVVSVGPIARLTMDAHARCRFPRLSGADAAERQHEQDGKDGPLPHSLGRARVLFDNGAVQRGSDIRLEESRRPEVAPADVRDSALLAAALARAFDADPVLNWVIRKDALRKRALRDFFDANLAYYFRHALVFAAAGCEGAALWAPPGKWDMGTWREALLLPTMVRVMGAPRVPIAIRCMARMKAAHPREPHYYLAVLGVVPERRGQRIGAALLAAGLSKCDAAHLPAYLENSNPENLGLYGQHGFEVIEEMSLGHGAPPLYRMRRPPR